MLRREALTWCAALLGGAVSAACTRAVLAAEAAADVAPQASVDPALRRTLEALADLVLPETETPGAVEAGVPAFMESLLTSWYTDDERTAFLAGLSRLDETSRARRAGGFADAPFDVRAAAFEAQEGRADGFYDMAREAVVVGYFTSETGVKKALDYVPIPGRYDGDFPMGRVTGHWSH